MVMFHSYVKLPEGTLCMRMLAVSSMASLRQSLRDWFLLMQLPHPQAAGTDHSHSVVSWMNTSILWLWTHHNSSMFTLCMWITGTGGLWLGCRHVSKSIRPGSWDASACFSSKRRLAWQWPVASSQDLQGCSKEVLGNNGPKGGKWVILLPYMSLPSPKIFRPLYMWYPPLNHGLREVYGMGGDWSSPTHFW